MSDIWALDITEYGQIDIDWGLIADTQYLFSSLDNAQQFANQWIKTCDLNILELLWRPNIKERSYHCEVRIDKRDEYGHFDFKKYAFWLHVPIIDPKVIK